MRYNKVWVIWGILVFVGVLFSVKDYKTWKRAETEKYGQGWAGQEKIVETAPLTGPYVNKIWRFRIKYPKDWTIKENVDYSESNPYRKALPSAGRKFQVIEFSNPNQSMTIAVWGETVVNRDLVDIVTERAIGIAGDREYRNNEKAKFTVIHWESSVEVKYQAFLKNADVVLTIEGKGALAESSLMSKTLMIMLEAFVPL